MIRPCAVVSLVAADGDTVAHEIFYSIGKARRSWKRAHSIDPKGQRVLVGETGKATWVAADRVILSPFFDYISTPRHQFRRSFLNLEEDEVVHLCEQLHLSPEVVHQIAQMEKDCYEKTKYYSQRLNERSKAMMRKWLPIFIIARLI